MTERAVIARVRDFFWLLQDRFRHVRAQQAAASLAFTTLLSLVPLIAVSVAVLSKFPVFEAIGASLRGFLLDNLLPDKAGAVIAKYTLQFSTQANKLTAVGSLLLFGAAIVMLLTIDRVFNQIWQVTRARPLYARLLIYWVVLTLGPVLLGGAVVAGTYVVSTSLGLVNEPRWVRTGAFGLVPFSVLVGFLTFLYFAVPNRRVRVGHALAGGVVAAGLLLVMQRLFGLYLSQFPSYAFIYGAFAVVPVFLLWLYACWAVILLGALIAAVLPEYAAGHSAVSRFPGRRYYGALLMLAELHRAQASGEARSLHVLTEASRLKVSDAESTLYILRRAGWVEKTEKQRWLLCCKLSDVPLRAVFDRLAFRASSLPPPAHPEEAALVARLMAIHGAAGQALEVPLSAIIDEALPPAQSQG